MTLWRYSFDGEEHPQAGQLFGREELQTRLMFNLPAESALISEAEEELCEKLAETGGLMPLSNCEDLDAARNLVKRLWACVVRIEDTPMLALEPPLRMILPLNSAGESYVTLRNALEDLSREVDGLLYLYGVIPAEDVFLKLSKLVGGTFADDEILLRRFLRTNFDYAMSDRGEMLLIHPGLADPAGVQVQRDPWNGPHSRELLEQACNGALWQEVAPYNRLLGLLEGAMRPEYDAASTVEDLAFLCKQQAPLEAVQEALAAALIVCPTETMRQAVRQLYLRVARWQTMRVGVLQ